MYFLMAMDSYAYLSGVSPADIHLTGYISHRIYLSLGVHLIVLRACISPGVHARGSYFIGVYLMGVSYWACISWVYTSWACI
jgi:uncharacterized membrane protein